MVFLFCFLVFGVPLVSSIPVVPTPLHRGWAVQCQLPVIGPYSLLPQGTLHLWWGARKAEPPNQTQVPSQTRRGICLGRHRWWDGGHHPPQTHSGLCKTELKWQILAWNILQTLPPVPTRPPCLTMQFLAPAPMPVLPRRGLAPGSKVTRVSCL